MLRITKSVLVELEQSQIWTSSTLRVFHHWKPDDIYGAEGKLNYFWGREWLSDEEMRKDLYQNMGGGVPVEIIEELIRLCVEHRGLT